MFKKTQSIIFIEEFYDFMSNKFHFQKNLRFFYCFSYIFWSKEPNFLKQIRNLWKILPDLLNWFFLISILSKTRGFRWFFIQSVPLFIVIWDLIINVPSFSSSWDIFNEISTVITRFCKIWWKFMIFKWDLMILVKCHLSN